MNKIKADSIIFDLDGTLWDSRQEVCNVWNEVLLNYDVKKKVLDVEDMTSTMGMLLDEIALKFFPEISDDERAELLDRCCSRENEYLRQHGGKLFENLENVLKELSKKYKLFIVSNCNDGYIESFEYAHGMEKYFTDIECPGRTGKKKKENIELIIERNNLLNPIYVGDTQGDLNAAHGAGIKFIYCAYGFGKNVEGYDYRIEEISDLLELF